MKQVLSIAVSLILAASLLVAGGAAGAAPAPAPTPQPTPGAGHVATAAELAKARSEWAQSRHANTYDTGLGANTTCASCKSPRNWTPNAQAQAEALDCSACKRIPGALRPELEGGLAVAQTDWKSIGCDVCHEPAGNSYRTAPVFWDQAKGIYEPVQSATELCGKCHEGQHGFQVIDEQAVSPAHNRWECTRCHGPHGSPVKCTNCHDPTIGKGAAEHARHGNVNCTACHDAGALDIWYDQEIGSKHKNEYAPVRFAHTVTSWSSHNLAAQVSCARCHHARAGDTTPVVANVVCTACHPDGAVSFWCRYFPRDFPLPTLAPRP